MIRNIIAEVHRPWVLYGALGQDLDLRVGLPAAYGNLGFLKTHLVAGICKMGPGHICDFSKRDVLRRSENWYPDVFPKSDTSKKT